VGKERPYKGGLVLLFLLLSFAFGGEGKSLFYEKSLKGSFNDALLSLKTSLEEEGFKVVKTLRFAEGEKETAVFLLAGKRVEKVLSLLPPFGAYAPYRVYLKKEGKELKAGFMKTEVFLALLKKRLSPPQREALRELEEALRRALERL